MRQSSCTKRQSMHLGRPTSAFIRHQARTIVDKREDPRKYPWNPDPKSRKFPNFYPDSFGKFLSGWRIWDKTIEKPPFCGNPSGLSSNPLSQGNPFPKSHMHSGCPIMSAVHQPPSPKTASAPPPFRLMPTSAQRENLSVGRIFQHLN